jgi:hypothetical protein
MVIQNKSTEIGDVIQIITDVPFLGLIALSSFIDDTVGEYTDRKFYKSFRYSVDGVNWTAFVELTDANIAGVEVQSNDTFFAEYLYQRIGTDATGELEFNSVTLNGEFVELTDGPAYIASIFNSYFNFNNICSISWSVNVLEKLYKKGIVPAFLERELTGTNADDRDYIDFWRAVTHYFALYVCLARKFQFFYQNQDLLLEYVKQRGLFVCEETSLVDLMYLMTNYYDEIRQRGTRQVFIPQATDITINGSKQVDGEFLRMICYDRFDEFLFNLNKNEHVGWNIGNSSPLYKSLTGRLNVNKYYFDFVNEITDLQYDLSLTDASYPFIALYDDSRSNSVSNSISSSISTNSDVDAVIIKNPGPGGSASIGGGDRRIIINPNLDYEITFYIKSSFAIDPLIIFGVNSYDKNGNFISLKRNDVNATSNEFLIGVQLNQPDKYYFVRGILFNKNNYKTYDPTKEYQPNTVVKYSGSTYYKSKRLVPVNGTIINDGVIDSTPGVTLTTSPYFWDFWQELTLQEIEQTYTTNLGIGNNLVLMDDVVQIDPYITYDNSNNSVNNLYIYDIRVQPLNTAYSKGFIQVPNFLELWYTNNNLNISQTKIEEDTRKFLIPYNTLLKTNPIPTEINR